MSSAPRLPFPHIIRTEWRLLYRDRTGILTLLLLAVASTYSVWDGQTRLRAHAAAHQALLLQEAQVERDAAAKAAASERQLDGKVIGSVDRYVRHGPTHPQWVGRNWAFRVAAMPPPALGHLTVGKLDVTPVVYRIRTDRLIEEYRQGELTAHPLRLFSGTLDPTTMVLFLIPLLVIALGADLVAGERERGTLDLVRSNPISLPALMLTRIGGRAMVTAIPLLIFGAATLPFVDRQADPAWRGKLAVWLAGSVAYLTIWWGATFLASVRSRTTARAVLVLSVCWVAALLIVPSAVRLAMDGWSPIPSRAMLIQAQRAATAKADASAAKHVLAKYLASDPALMARYGPLLPQTDTFGFASGPYYLIGEARDYLAETEIRPMLDRWESARQRQERMARWLSVLSPAMLAHSMLLDAVGTGDRGLRNFRRVVDTFHDQWRAFFLPRIFDMQIVGPAEYAALPRFSYRSPSLTSVVGDTWAACVGLFAGAAVLFASAWRSFFQEFR